MSNLDTLDNLALCSLQRKWAHLLGCPDCLESGLRRDSESSGLECVHQGPRRPPLGVSKAQGHDQCALALHCQLPALAQYKILLTCCRHLDDTDMLNHACREAGTWVGYLSSCLYLSSRMSQIHKNWSRRSAEGLAYAMFICSISANCLYGVGILIRTYHSSQLWSSLPWLIGSLGTVSLDIIILSQVDLCLMH